MSNAVLGLRLKQQLTLTPRLQQSVKLLQLSALECVQELHQAIAQNPFLEESAETAEAADSREEREEASEDTSRADLDFSTSRGSGSGEETPDWTEWTASPSTLHDSLREQLLLLGLTERDHVLANLIVDALDDDGFLRLPLEDVAALAPGAAPGEIETALRIVQTLEPNGIAARSLGECLALQLEAMDSDTPGRSIALEVVQNRLSLMAARDNTRLLEALGCSPEELRLALELIRRLDPRPGSKVGTFEPRAIVPDVIVRKDKKRWVVTVNSAIYPRIRVNQQYADYFRQARDGESALLAQHLQEARWLVRNLEQRFLTIQRVAEAVVARQRNFFEYGDLAMRPLTLREIADELGLHESTVSRATSHKFMATPRGVVAFKRFFSRQLATTSGGSCSATAIRALLREFIAAEDRRNPLSDVQLTGLLADRGVKVARRTVTKYRRSMQLPAVDFRRA
ncbi:MAG TPA: RNA polymerase factor sigma-54 [Steroidobacteraceae bacterium]|jgi:RNA polymerase sigma-54 factor|nr:RNA polymerase factor sigma-54 [Steroidobacteraceae bacterium]